jgi:hypothetical protein
VQLFGPALAAVSAGAGHIFRWREEGVRSTELAEAIRSELWKYQTRAGAYTPAMADEMALGTLVSRVDDLNLKAVSRWATIVLSDGTGPPASSPAPAEST